MLGEIVSVKCLIKLYDQKIRVELDQLNANLTLFSNYYLWLLLLYLIIFTKGQLFHLWNKLCNNLSDG